ncbi:hypothetical protein CYMTET_36460, partial [Cymbomonas tetramitiformis]
MSAITDSAWRVGAPGQAELEMAVQERDVLGQRDGQSSQLTAQLQQELQNSRRQLATAVKEKDTAQQEAVEMQQAVAHDWPMGQAWEAQACGD